MGCLFRGLSRLLLLVLTFAIVVGVVMYFSPRPGVFAIRFVFDRGTNSTEDAIASFEPDDVTTIADVSYREHDGDALLNVYFPSNTTDGEVLPTVLWIHGGAWVSGSREDYGTYHRMIAAEGFTVVSVGYSLGPEAQYPTPLIQINAALNFLQDNAAEFHVDVDRFVFAGDSAGAQIGSQLATMITNPNYATQVGVIPALDPDQLRGVILYCGIYDIDTFLNGHDVGPRILRWGSTTAIWAYTGSKDADTVAGVQMSTLNFVTKDFPATFISGGNGDHLTDDQSVPLADKLDALGVDVTTVFFPDDHDPSLGHEYQFSVNTDDGKQTFAKMIAWLQDVTA
jgi:acetyl esterase/lipase